MRKSPTDINGALPRFGLTRQQVVYGLERVELRSTDLFRRCPTAGGAGGRTPRQFDDNNNNLENFIQIRPQGWVIMAERPVILSGSLG